MSAPRQALPDLWHYTCGIKIPLILESGYLLPIPTNYAPKDELPVIWLSHHPVFEPTAAKGFMNARTGQVQTLGMQGTHEKCGGLYRLKISPDIITHDLEWFRANSGINRKVFKSIVSVGRRQGANPDHWRVCEEAIPLVAIDRVEAWTGTAWEKSEAMA